VIAVEWRVTTAALLRSGHAPRRPAGRSLRSQQARAESGFFRYKSVLGGGLMARDSIAQTRGAMIGCHILNRMAELGKSESYAVVS